MPANLENSAVATGLVSFHSNPKERQCQRSQTTAQLHSSHMLVNKCSKFSKPVFRKMWTVNLQIFKQVLENVREPVIQLPTFSKSSKKQETFIKTSLSALLTMPKPLTVWITINYGKFWKRWKYLTTWPDFWEICMQARKQRLELDMQQQTGSK